MAKFFAPCSARLFGSAEPCRRMAKSLKPKGFFFIKVRVVFFEKTTQKISTLFPLIKKILAVLAWCQVDHT
ncbi:hypothetical protein [Bacillus thuringiensis]|uniref:hypothetical protein n=1 Tax=Bacillus thuringiensis TaxID=1428 RepID=UPI00159BDAC7|nr:hypothetical protein [Bacillus thuringiensis]